MKTPLVEPGQEFWGVIYILVCVVGLVISIFLDNKYVYMVV